MPQNLSRNPYDINIPSPGVTQGEMLARLQQALIEQQINEADIVASEAKAARTQARLADPIEAMNTQDQMRRFQLRRDVVPQPAPIRGIRAALAGLNAADFPMAGSRGPVPQPAAAPAVIRGVRRITEGSPAAPRPQTTAFGTAIPRTTQTSFGGRPGGLSSMRESAEQMADPNYAADLARRENDAMLNPAVLAAGVRGDAAARAAAAKAGTATTQNANEANDALDLIDQIGSDPALSTAVGPVDAYIGKARDLSGVNRFEALHNQLVGKLQLAIAGKLRGQGQISDKERAMLKQAATALNRNLSEEDYKIQLEKIRGQFQRLLPGGGAVPAAPAGAGPVDTAVSTAGRGGGADPLGIR